MSAFAEGLGCFAGLSGSLNPAGVGGGGAAGERDQFGAVIGVQPGPKFLQDWRFAGRGFAENKKFPRLFPFPFPDVVGLDRREDLDTGSGLGVKGGAGELGSV